MLLKFCSAIILVSCLGLFSGCDLFRYQDSKPGPVLSTQIYYSADFYYYYGWVDSVTILCAISGWFIKTYRDNIHESGGIDESHTLRIRLPNQKLSYEPQRTNPSWFYLDTTTTRHNPIYELKRGYKKHTENDSTWEESYTTIFDKTTQRAVFSIYNKNLIGWQNFEYVWGDTSGLR